MDNLIAWVLEKIEWTVWLQIDKLEESKVMRVAVPARTFVSGSLGGVSNVGQIMNSHVALSSPKDSVQHAAKLMADEDAGFLPVAENDRLIGMITDRDIAIRVCAHGRDPANTQVSQIMTKDIKYCFEDEPIDHVAKNMAELQVRRLPVMSREKKLVGVVSIGDIAKAGDISAAGEGLRGIARESGQHNQNRGMQRDPL